MKKTLFFIVFFALGVLMVAQRPAGSFDTIYGRNPTYMYPTGWMDPYDSIQPPYGRGFDTLRYRVVTRNYPNNSLYGIYFFEPELASKFYTDRPVKIIGAATSFVMGYYDDYVGDSSVVVFPEVPGIGQRGFMDTNFATWAEWLKIYKHINDAGHDTMMMIREKEFNCLDTARYMRSYRALHGWSGTSDNKIFVVYEVYFDKPVVIYDSFYVAITQNCRQTDSVYTEQGDIALYRHHRSMTLNVQDYHDSLLLSLWRNGQLTQEIIDSLYNPFQYGIAMMHPVTRHWEFGYGGAEWAGFYGQFRIPFLFPIIDTTGLGLRPFGLPCDRVRGLRTANVWERNAMLMWDGSDGHNRWELAVGPAADDPSTYRIYRVNSTSRVLSELDSNVMYAARVRAECTPKTNYSDWSDTVQFTIGMSDPQGIASMVDQFTFITPNPAKGRVNVLSSFGLRHVDVYDMGGRCVLNQDCSGLAQQLDLTALPAGTYIAVVTTAGGTTAKRLTLSR